MPRIAALFLCLALCLLPALAIAENENADAADARPAVQLPKSIVKGEKTNFLTLVVENDMFGKGTDQNYTSGVRLTYFNVNAHFPDFAHRIADLTPTFEINPSSSVFYSIGQNLYTPDDITNPLQNPDDRPWAAYLYASIGMTSLTHRHLDEIEASIGVVGPWALGKQTQSFVHRHISDSPIPRGWGNQLKNEPVLMLGWQRRWPEYRSYYAAGLRFSTAPHIGITLGNVHTFANTGLGFRLGPEVDRWQDTPVRVRPAMPGTGFFDIPEKGWSWFFFGGIDARAVGHNIFLDGNTFRNSHNVSKRHFVADSNIGLALTLKQFRISYTLNHRTRTFKKQDEDELFGAVSLNFRF
ncbi:MAG: lipid A deacylase LpxR family protein [Micavibrio sp.]|nr:MAG: lipid A deacylase LpxR family protein [Micavibrio sp.]